MNFAEIKLNSILQRNLTFDCANGLSVVYKLVKEIFAECGDTGAAG